MEELVVLICRWGMLWTSPLAKATSILWDWGVDAGWVLWLVGLPDWVVLLGVYCIQSGSLAWLWNHLLSGEATMMEPLVRLHEWAMLQGGPCNSSCFGEVSSYTPQTNFNVGCAPCLGGAICRTSLSDLTSCCGLLKDTAEACSLN